VKVVKTRMIVQVSSQPEK